eukprot:TRINITY_DN48176_c0_g1_i1.p2 TRINITY_DN48176_c0_g1~~TRINITY_DN48176_c0_g1_i1.p2  ORF type:complete len:120 (+),score=30.84 TRINITY_DN48176_c0_g1_i1:116-475(+)
MTALSGAATTAGEGGADAPEERRLLEGLFFFLLLVFPLALLFRPTAGEVFLAFDWEGDFCIAGELDLFMAGELDLLMAGELPRLTDWTVDDHKTAIYNSTSLEEQHYPTTPNTFTTFWK